jgi:hypothetical protein
MTKTVLVISLLFLTLSHPRNIAVSMRNVQEKTNNIFKLQIYITLGSVKVVHFLLPFLLQCHAANKWNPGAIHKNRRLRRIVYLVMKHYRMKMTHQKLPKLDWKWVAVIIRAHLICFAVGRTSKGWKNMGIAINNSNWVGMRHQISAT